MLRKRVWIPIVCVLVIAMGCGLFYGRKVANQEPVKTYKPVDVSEQPVAPKPPPPGETFETGHWHGDEWHSEPHSAHAPAEVSEQPPLVSAVEAPPPPELAEAPPVIETPIETEPDFVNPTSTSSNPLFADGVPEHLQCPSEWIGAYFKEIEPETIQRLQQIGVEIIDQWNPNRPLTEVYPAFIEADKWYRGNTDPERAGLGWAGNRIDWQLQLSLDYPEISVLAQEDPDRSFYMWRVEIGEWSPDFNLIRLGDGRTFRTDADKKYVFTSSTYTETADGFESSTSTSTRGPANGDPNAEVIEINLDLITDEELEALSGWNYNINPYTTGAYQLGDHR
ncbi:MAG: hypothetical protein OXG97_07365 [Candidatus Poribacteria bacterium]|nr:hypothetical protein [Candidatus Poribacteria bacterium]